MRKSFVYKLFKNKHKSRKLTGELRLFCQIYNHCLALTRRHYKLFGKNPKKSDLQKHVAKRIREGHHPEWAELGYSQGVQQVIDRIYLSYVAFFKWAKSRQGGKKSPPKFKPFRKYKSFTLKQAGWELDVGNRKIRIGKTWYRYNKSRSIEGTPKTVIIKRDQVGDWFIIISCDLVDDFAPEKIAPTTGKSAGFDFGLKSFLVTSDGERHESPEFLKNALTDLRKKNRAFSLKKKGSKNRKKAGKNLARAHRKIANKRRDSHFKLALNLVREHDQLFFEDLNLSAMKKLWGRKISDYGFSEFLKVLEFKAIEHRKTVHKIGRFYPSSKTCSDCDIVKQKLGLKERVFKCECGFEIDRDLNAAINILREGASSLGLDGVSPDLDLASVA